MTIEDARDRVLKLIWMFESDLPFDVSPQDVEALKALVEGK